MKRQSNADDPWRDSVDGGMPRSAIFPGLKSGAVVRPRRRRGASTRSREVVIVPDDSPGRRPVHRPVAPGPFECELWAMQGHNSGGTCDHGAAPLSADADRYVIARRMIRASSRSIPRPELHVPQSTARTHRPQAFLGLWGQQEWSWSTTGRRPSSKGLRQIAQASPWFSNRRSYSPGARLYISSTFRRLTHARHRGSSLSDISFDGPKSDSGFHALHILHCLRPSPSRIATAVFERRWGRSGSIGRPVPARLRCCCACPLQSEFHRIGRTQPGKLHFGR